MGVRDGQTATGLAWRIRPTRADDAEWIVAVRDAVAAEGDSIAARPGDRTAAQESLELAGILTDGGLSLTLEVDARVAGHLVCRRRYGDTTGPVAEVALIVAHAARGMGLGRELMVSAVEWARDTGITRLVLAVLPENTRALALYRRIGFVEEGSLPRQVRIGGIDRDLLLMGLTLGG